MTDILQTSQWQQSTVPAECAGLRLDNALSKLFCLSRSSLQRLIEDGLVRVNGKEQKKRYMVAEGDVLDICPEPPPPSQVAPEPMTFDVLYEDSSLFIINKPPGLVVHPAPGNRSGTFVNGLVAYLTDLECQDPIRPGLVHRLDKYTSGVLIAAKTPSVLSALSLQFHDRTVHKEYLAIVAGRCTENMESSEPIGRDPKNRQRMAIVQGGKEAHTEIFPLHQSEEWTLVKAVPHTGRTHQVRVHLTALGYPILGDTLYGKRDGYAKWKGQRQMLHCWSLTFVHPVTGKPLVVQAPIPKDMCEILGQDYVSDCTTCS
jgi:23S rRNA pseudouridine1911/1915/1917 synthase